MDPKPSEPPDLERGRQAYERREWKAAHDALRSADDQAPLGPDDLWRLALASYLIGRDDGFVEALERGHQSHLDAGDETAAARCAFWIGFHLASRGDMAQASGWLGRAGRLVERQERDCVERGYLLLPVAYQQLLGADYEAAYGTAGTAVAVGERFGDRDLLAFALHMQGRALMEQARIGDGLALLDEAMVAVATGELSPQVTGLIYCSVIGACRRVYALHRAHEWTAALADWCEEQPDMVAYTGECLAYRAEIMQLRGAWGEAFDEAGRARERVARGAAPGAGALALYQQGELHRLRGELAAAEEAYRAASRAGREPQPGLSLLRLAQGRSDAAAAAIGRALAETRDPLQRARLLPAHVEIMLAVGQPAEARGACDELAETARLYEAEVLETLVATARGAIELDADNALPALVALRQAARGWQALDAPYEAARVRVLLGRACRELGDDDTATLELDAARAEFERLGAAPDVAGVDALTRRPSARRTHGLTPRELEVLAVLATGRTNRAIADELFVSEKTVARHVANIFAKLGLSSRSAATAYAYEHDLLNPPA